MLKVKGLMLEQNAFEVASDGYPLKLISTRWGECLDVWNRLHHASVDFISGSSDQFNGSEWLEEIFMSS